MENLNFVNLIQAGIIATSILGGILLWKTYEYRGIILLLALSGLASIINILEETGIESRFVELELTESFLMDDQEFAINTLKELKSMGFQLSIDDFGTGYSSLSYLKKFPIDRLKIDRSFVVDIEQNEEDRAIVRAIIDLAHTLKISVIAEGVEDRSQSDMLTRMGCDIIQGYLYSKPIDGVAFTLYLQQENESHTSDV